LRAVIMRPAFLLLLVVILFSGAFASAGQWTTAAAGQVAEVPTLPPLPNIPCYGAAARDPERPCFNPELATRVSPKPSDALLTANSPCRSNLEIRGTLVICEMLSWPEQPTSTIALIGDSHASHWRAGLEVVAAEQRWRGYSLTRAGCPLTLAVPVGRSCARWNRLVRRWLRQHPEVETVFVSQKAGSRVVPPRGRDARRSQISGYKRAWRALPKTVKHVIVIRDVPKTTQNTAACITRAVRRGRRPGSACAVPRSFALREDRAVVAAREYASEKVGVVDLRRFFCKRRVCPPVIGGVLVHKDNNHLTTQFTISIGPDLARAVRRLMATWTPNYSPAAKR
jgi:hypothetical protein